MVLLAQEVQQDQIIQAVQVVQEFQVVRHNQSVQEYLRGDLIMVEFCVEGTKHRQISQPDHIEKPLEKRKSSLYCLNLAYSNYCYLQIYNLHIDRIHFHPQFPESHLAPSIQRCPLGLEAQQLPGAQVHQQALLGQLVP